MIKLFLNFLCYLLKLEGSENNIKFIVILFDPLLKLWYNFRFHSLIKIKHTHFLLPLCNIFIYIDKSICTCPQIGITKAFFKYYRFIFLSDFIIIESIPFLTFSIKDKSIIVALVTTSSMYQDCMQIKLFLLLGRSYFDYFLINLLKLLFQYCNFLFNLFNCLNNNLLGNLNFITRLN